MLEIIVSGGQTGADRAALDWAIANQIPHGGWCPKGRKAEDGPLPPRYNLRETTTGDYIVRTRRNVMQSDGTLLVNVGMLDGGTRRTLEIAMELDKPVLVVLLDGPSASAARVVTWLARNRVRELNVAGPRESKRPGIYAATLQFLGQVIALARAMAEPRRVFTDAELASLQAKVPSLTREEADELASAFRFLTLTPGTTNRRSSADDV